MDIPQAKPSMENTILLYLQRLFGNSRMLSTMKNGLYKLNFSLAALTIGLFWLSSCGGSDTKEQAAGLDTNAVAQKSEVLNAVDSLLRIMPKPSAVPNIIARTGAEYNPAYLCDMKAVEKVEGNASATAFCLGVFGADIAYMAAYEKGKDALNRFVSGKKMADRIGISGAFDVHLMERMETNLSNRDSLIELTDSYIQKSSEILKSGDQTKDAALISSGAVIEGLYLTNSLIRDYPATGLPKEQQDRILIPLYKTLFEQEASISSLISLFEKIEGDTETQKLQGLLNELAGVYREGKWNERIASGKGQITPDMFDISKLDAAIVKLRSAMVP